MRRKKYTIEEVKQYAEQKGGICLSNEYKNNKKKLLWKCGICSHEWLAGFKSVKIQENWCPKCSGRLNNNLEVAKKLAESRNGFCLSKKYVNNKTNMLWKCGKCEHTWQARLDRVKSGTWCPNCKRSHGERKISAILKSKGISFKCEHHLGKKQMRFDFYIPELNTAIEYDGIQHFKIYRRYTPNQETLDKRQHFDYLKTLHCLENKIKIIRVHYTSLNNLSNILEQALETEYSLVFTEWGQYRYIIDKLPVNTIFYAL